MSLQPNFEVLWIEQVLKNQVKPMLPSTLSTSLPSKDTKKASETAYSQICCQRCFIFSLLNSPQPLISRGFPSFPTSSRMVSRQNVLFVIYSVKLQKGNEDGQIVYITEKGTVWHSDYQCSYLQLSIQYVQYSELQNMRNEGGGKYHKCEQCVYGQAMNGVYITSYGNRYHNSLNCSSLKRTIRAVHKSEVAGRGGCSKCAK